MEVPMGKAIDGELKKLGLEYVDAMVMNPCSHARPAISMPANRLTGNSFWEVADHHRFDLIFTDIPRVANQFAYAIALASIYHPFVAYTIPISRGKDHHLFWHNVDSATRLAASGWDRLALFLDAVFATQLTTRCSIRLVLKEIKKVDPTAGDNEHFKWLVQFCDGAYSELAGKHGEGARNEATHNLSPSIREYFESLEETCTSSTPPSTKRADARMRMLTEHYKLLNEGINNAIGLVCWKFPAK